MPAARILPILFALTAVASGWPAAGQIASATSHARLVHPLSVIKIDDLDFGEVLVTAAGTVAIDPNTNAATYTGGAAAAGRKAQPALFMGAAQKRTVVNIRVPKLPITLTREGGAETLIVNNWTLQGQNKRELASRSTFTFAVGATLAVPAEAVEGTYTGSFEVEVQYP